MKFLADRMLGKLAKRLRMLGYDTVYYQGTDPEEMLQLARRGERIILTRNATVVPGSPEDRIFRIGEDLPSRQLEELRQRRLLSFNPEKLFSRCLVCNAVLESIGSPEAEGKVPDFVFYHQKEFFRCPQCARIYWKGSHQENMRKWVEDFFRHPDEEMAPHC